MKNIPLKICGITNVKSVEVAHKNKIKSLGFASKNLNGPNTVSDKKIQSLIKECKNYKIESVLLTRYVSLDKLIEQIDFTKPKTISCSYHFPKKENVIEIHKNGKIQKIKSVSFLGLFANQINLFEKIVQKFNSPISSPVLVNAAALRYHANQKGIKVAFNEIKNANHFFKSKESDLRKAINTIQRIKFISVDEIDDNILDEILKGLVEDEISVEKIVSKGFDRKVVEKTAQLLARSEYKRFQAAPGPKVTNKAFGRDRRFPLTSGFRNWN